MSVGIVTNYNVDGNDFGSKFWDLTNNQNIDGNKTFNNAITRNNCKTLCGCILYFKI
jgi:uncharacterized lipoprotein YddW (UPF0748 family)